MTLEPGAHALGAALGLGFLGWKHEEQITIEEGQHLQIEVGLGGFLGTKLMFSQKYFEGHVEY